TVNQEKRSNMKALPSPHPQTNRRDADRFGVLFWFSSRFGRVRPRQAAADPVQSKGNEPTVLRGFFLAGRIDVNLCRFKDDELAGVRTGHPQLTCRNPFDVY